MIHHFSTPLKMPLRLYPTNKCNFRCVTPRNTQFCDHIYEDFDADFDALVSISRLFFENQLSDIVKISGREPTLYPKLPALIQSLRKVFSKIMLSTNGTSSISLMQSLIDQGVSIFALPFHTNNRQKYGAMCGLPAQAADFNFDQSSKNIEYLAKQNQEIHLIRVLIRNFNDSFEELDEFIEICGKYHAMGKLFLLNYHPNINRPLQNDQFICPPSTASAEDVFNDLKVQIEPFHQYIKERAIKNQSFSNKYSLRTISVYEMENGARMLFDSFEPVKNKYDFCQSCTFLKVCKEGPYSNGWEIRPDQKLQICPMRPDLTVDLQSPEKIKKIEFHEGRFNVIR